MKVDFYIVKNVLSAIEQNELKAFIREGKWQCKGDMGSTVENTRDYILWLLNILVEAGLIVKVRHKDKQFLNCDYELTYRGTNFVAMLKTDYIWDYIHEKLKMLQLYPSFKVVEALGEEAIQRLLK